MVAGIALRKLRNQNLVGSEVLAPAVHVGDVFTLRVDGDMIGIDAQIVVHLLANRGFIDTIIFHVFQKNKIIAHAVATTVFHHVATRVFKSHSIHRNLPEIGEHTRDVVVVGTRTVVDIVDDGGVAVLKDVPRTIIAHPVGVGLRIDEGHIAHVDARTLETVLGLVLLIVAHNAIHHAIIRKLRYEACRDAQRITDHHALHGFKLGHKTRLARRRVGLDEVHATRFVVHFLFGEIVPPHPIGFFLLGLHSGGHQE